MPLICYDDMTFTLYLNASELQLEACTGVRIEGGEIVFVSLCYVLLLSIVIPDLWSINLD